MKDLRKAFERHVLRWAKVKGVQWSGCPAYQADGKIFTLLINDGVIVAKLSGAEQDELMRLENVAIFEAGDKSVRNWIRFSLNNKKDLRQIMPFVKRNYQAAF